MKTIKILPFFCLSLTLSCSQFFSKRAPANVYEGSDDEDSSYNFEVVDDVEALRARIANAKEGEVIVLNPKSVFDFTDKLPLVLKKKIILKGQKSSDSKERPLFINKKVPYPMISVEADGVVIERIKLEGLQIDAKKEEIIALNKKGIKGVYQFPVTRGIHVKSNNVVIRDCIIKGFSHAAIYAENALNLLVEHNMITYNQRWGLGYGVALHLKSTAFITRNHFNFNRHSIAGSGSIGQSYEASYNYFGSNHNDSPLDMHGGKDRGDGTNIAGLTVHIHHNKISDGVNFAFIHRGIAQDKVIFEHNLLSHKDHAKVIGFYNGVTKANLPSSKFIYQNNHLSE
jgi:hypothetical protein